MIMVLLSLKFYYKEPIRAQKNIPNNLIKLNIEIIEAVKQSKLPKDKDMYQRNQFWDYRVSRLQMKKLIKFWDKDSLSPMEKVMLKIAKELNIGHIMIAENPITIHYDLEYSYRYPNWYYAYSSNDYIEAEIVPAIEEAVDGLEDKSIYYFGEEADTLHWFIGVVQD